MFRTIILVYLVVCLQTAGMSQVIVSPAVHPVDTTAGQRPLIRTSSATITTSFLSTGKYRSEQLARMMHDPSHNLYTAGNRVFLYGEFPSAGDREFFHTPDFRMNNPVNKKSKLHEMFKDAHFEELIRPFFMENIFK